MPLFLIAQKGAINKAIQKGSEMLDFDLLHKEFNYRALIPLEELIERGYLSLGIRTAKNRAALDLLPFPVVRPEDSQKSTYMVAIHDFYEWINGRVKGASDSWQNMNGSIDHHPANRT